MGAHAVASQDIKEPVPVQCIISLVQVQEDPVQDLLSQGCQLLKQFGLKGAGTCAVNRPKSLEEVVEGDGGCELSIYSKQLYLRMNKYNNNKKVHLTMHHILSKRLTSMAKNQFLNMKRL